MPVLTPNGRTRLSFHNPLDINSCWITANDYPNLSVMANDPTQGAYIEKMIVTACAQINRLCNRYWNNQTADQIFVNDKDYYGGFQTYILENGPINSVTDMYLQVSNTFLQISPQYLQQFSDERTIKVFPFIQYAGISNTFHQVDVSSKLSFWIRYNSGPDGVNVFIPEDIKYATSLMVDYLSNPSGVISFRTQTYQQVNGTRNTNPLYDMILSLIEPYILYTVV